MGKSNYWGREDIQRFLLIFLLLFLLVYFEGIIEGHFSDSYIVKVGIVLVGWLQH